MRFYTVLSPVTNRFLKPDRVLRNYTRAGVLSSSYDAFSLYLVVSVMIKKLKESLTPNAGRSTLSFVFGAHLDVPHGFPFVPVKMHLI